MRSVEIVVFVCVCGESELTPTLTLALTLTTSTHHFPARLLPKTHQPRLPRPHHRFVLYAEVYTGLGDLRSVQSVLSARDDVAVSADGEWHHVAFAYDQSTLTLSCDGIVVAETTWDVPKPLHASVYHHPLTLGNNMDGKIDEVVVWAVAKPAAELANTRWCPGFMELSAVVAYFGFNEGDGLHSWGMGAQCGAQALVRLTASESVACLAGVASGATWSPQSPLAADGAMGIGYPGGVYTEAVGVPETWPVSDAGVAYSLQAKDKCVEPYPQP